MLQSLSDFWHHFPIAWVLTWTLVGLTVGSFINVVIYRLPKMMEQAWQDECTWYLNEQATESPTAPSAEPSERLLPPEPDQGRPRYNLCVPRSHCPHCQTPIPGYRNIPLVSFIVQRGRCAACKAAISWRYPLVEAVAGLLALIAALSFGASWLCVAVTVLLLSLLTLTVIDIDTYLLPDQITLPLLWLGLIINTQSLISPPVEAVIGAAAGYLTLWSVYWLFKLSTGKEGMGYGDFKLLAALGAWLGWKMLLPIILISSLIGCAVALLLIGFRHRAWSKPLPFGPYLAIGGGVTLFFGKSIERLFV